MKAINKNSISVKKIISKTINEILTSKVEIVNIIDYSRNEYENIKYELETIKQKTKLVIDEVDTLEIQDKVMRKKLADVSKNFKIYKENHVKNVYDQALEIRTKFMSKKNEEKMLISKRTELEMSLKRSIKTIDSAENAINQIGVAVSYLKGEILSSFEGIDKDSEMFFGIKILEAQENERKRISRDIHDGPAQYVSNILMKADICEKIIKLDLNEGLNELKDLKDAVKLALKEVRDIIYDLRPMSLDDLGLNKTIEEFVKKFNNELNFNIDLKLKPIVDEIESIIQIAIFRIIQEIFNNIKKHSKAKNIKLNLDYGTKYVRIVIKDDGIGFNVEETLDRVKSKGNSYGLVGILERVKQLQGDIIIESKINNGTVYNIKLPVNREVIKDEKFGN